MQPRVEPHDIDAEQAVLGAMLISKDKRSEAVTELTTSDFYDSRHQLIYQAIEVMEAKKEATDTTNVASYLNTSGHLEAVGGVAYLLELANSLPVLGHTSYYIRTLQNKAMLRNIITESSIITAQAYEDGIDVADFLAQSEKRIMAATKNRTSGEFKEIGEVLGEIKQELIILSKSDNTTSGVPSGFVALDAITHGFHPGALIIVAARPAMGKTAFALNLVQAAAHESRDPVVLFSLEMDAASLLKRIICSTGSITGEDIKTGNILKSGPGEAKYQATVEKVSKCNLYIDDSGGITINDIAAKCRQLKSQKGGIRMIVVDYLQLINGSGNKPGDNRQQEVSEISRQLKSLARELEVPVIALSQLSRGVESRTDKRPMLSDLRESGAIEQDADMVSFIYREGYYKKTEDQKDDNGLTEIIIAKHRNGPTGTIHLMFENSYSRFIGVTKQQIDGTKDVR
ncbi:replicative DNA helicase [Tannockella kyphosi]|uniref:replicative DNA helicase n=1 Tax=Tannockella kyphosi TaxID=2899121 RepID=UPI002012F530|nr:replicative DNA helicase [Tannockella kyphosi]